MFVFVMLLVGASLFWVFRYCCCGVFGLCWRLMCLCGFGFGVGCLYLVLGSLLWFVLILVLMVLRLLRDLGLAGLLWYLW